jgi:uncharacterized integral membrane protein
MQKIRWFFLIAAILLALAIVLQNNTSVPVQLFWLQRSLPLSALLLSTTAIGFLLGALVTAWMLRRRGKAANAKKAAPEPAPAEAPAAQESAESNPLTS